MRVLYYLCIAIAIYFGYSIIKILVADVDRLTQYGWGYLTGQLVLFVLFAAISFLLAKRHAKKQASARHKL